MNTWAFLIIVLFVVAVAEILRFFVARSGHGVSGRVQQIRNDLDEQLQRNRELRTLLETDRVAADREFRALNRQIVELKNALSALLELPEQPESKKADDSPSEVLPALSSRQRGIDDIALAALKEIVPGFEPSNHESKDLPDELLTAAQLLTHVRPLVPYPGWHFDSDWSNPNLSSRMRRHIWLYLRERGFEVPFIMGWHEGLVVKLHLPNDLSRLVFVAGCTDPNDFCYLRRILKPGMVFLDAGANEGLYTLFAAKRVGCSGRVLAFEPSKREFERLRENIRINALNNVIALPAALGNSEGERQLKIADSLHPGQNTLGAFMHSEIQLIRTETVAVRTLDSIVKEHNLDRVDVIKIDVEGAEKQLLEGAMDTLGRMRPVVLLEVSEKALGLQGTRPQELIDLLQSLQYVMHRFDPLTGLPVQAQLSDTVENMIAVPLERTFSSAG